MARKSRHSIQKRQRELRKREKQDAKRIKKAARATGEFDPDAESEEDGEVEIGPDGLPIPRALPLDGAVADDGEVDAAEAPDAEPQAKKEEDEVPTPL